MRSIVTGIVVLISTVLSAQVTEFPYKDGTQKLTGRMGIPLKPNKAKAGVLILPAWKGIDEHAIESANRLTNVGYYTFIADIYGDGNAPADNAAAGKLSSYYKENYTDYQKRIKAALQQLQQSGADINNIAIVGYCFGGTGALEAARGLMAVRGVVSVHGGLLRKGDRKDEPLAAKILVLHGAEDPHVPASEIAAFQDEMKKCNADYQMISYAGAVHAFSDPYAGSDVTSGAAFNPVAARRSWEHMLVFFRELFK